MNQEAIFEGSCNPKADKKVVKKLRDALKKDQPLHEGWFQGLRREEVTQILTETNDNYPTELLDGYDILYGNGSLASMTDRQYLKSLVPTSLIEIALSQLNSRNYMLYYFPTEIISDQPIKEPPLLYDTSENSTLLHQIALDSKRIQPRYRREILLSRTHAQTFLRACYVLSEIERIFPGQISDDNLPISIKIFKIRPEMYSIGLLQGLKSLGVLNDHRFHSLTQSLRHHVLINAESYENLCKKYQYSVMDETEFWIDGEIALQQEQQKPHQLQSESRDIRIDTETTTISLPSIDKWNVKVRTIQDTQQTIRLSTQARHLISAITEEPLDTSPISQARMAKSIAQQQAHKMAKQQQLGNQKETLRSLYKNKYAKELKFLGKPDEYEEHILRNVVVRLIKSVSSDPNISQKTKTWAQSLENQSETILTGDYSLHLEKLKNNPLFSWIFALRDPVSQQNFLAAIQRQPQEFTLLYRLMVDEVARQILIKEEDDYLFRPLFESESFREEYQRAQAFFLDLANEFSPQDSPDTILEILKKISAKTDEALHDLLDPKKIDEKKKKIRESMTRSIMGIRVPRSFGVHGPTLKALAKLILIASSASTATIVIGSELISKLKTESNNLTNSIHGETSSINSRTTTPDTISREDLLRQTPTLFADVFHVPDFLAGAENFQLDFPVSIDDPNDLEIVGDFEHVTFGEFPQDYLGNPNHLVIQMNNVPQIMYPPLGFSFEEIYQEDGLRPLLTATGEVIWPESGTTPKRAIVVLSPENHELNFSNIPNVHFIGSQQGYDLQINFDTMNLVLQELSGDPDLQALYRSLIQSLQQLKDLNITDRNRYSIVLLEFMTRYQQYIQERRHYALDLTAASDYNPDPIIPYLSTIANNPNAGFFCSYAARAFEDFFRDTGVQIFYQSVSPTRFYDNQLWKLYGHANNRVILPNGMVFVIDTTPPSNQQTPQADLEILSWQRVDEYIARQNTLNEIAKVATRYGIPLIEGLAFAAGLSELYRGRKRRALVQKFQRLCESLGDKKFSFSELEKNILGHVIGYIGLLEYTNPEQYADSITTILSLLQNVDIKKHGGLIRWINENYLKEDYRDINKFLASLEERKKRVFAYITERWFSNSDGVRDYFSDEEQQIISERLQKSEPIEDFDESIDAAIKLGLTLQAIEIIDLIKKVKKCLLEEEHVRSDLQDRLTSLRKTFTAKEIAFLMSEEKGISPQNKQYFLFLLQALEKHTGSQIPSDS